MKYKIELADIIKKNFFGLDFDTQLKILTLYENSIEDGVYLKRNFHEIYSKYVARIATITLFKPNFKLLNTEGKRFIRHNLINQLNSVGYNNRTDMEKYGLTKDQLLSKYLQFKGSSKNADDIISKFSPEPVAQEIVDAYFKIFKEFSLDEKNEIINSFTYYNMVVSEGYFSDYMYPSIMADKFDEEMKVLLLEYYREYKKMTPDRKMEYIHDIVTKQMPRAFKYMDELEQVEEKDKVKTLIPITG
jgi:hypothetical protein